MEVIMVVLIIISFTIVDSVDVGDFVNGLAFANGYLWACENYSDNIYKIDPATMQIVGYFHYSGGLDGLAHDGLYLWLGYYPASIHKIDTLGNTIGTWPSPGGEYSYGMTFDGQYLWHSDKNLRRIYKLDYNDPTVIIESFQVSWEPQDLGWYRSHLWAVANYVQIYELDPTNMNIINSWTTGRPYSAGLALGGGYLWFGTTNRTGWVYKVEGVVDIEEEAKKSPASGWVSVFPNPFRGSTTLSLKRFEDEKVEVKIFNAAGRLVRSLFCGKAGSELIWDGRDDFYSLVPPGVYYFQITSGTTIVNQKIVYLGR
ncbi:hypothetical protein DRP53_00540 [candidate division WOR-3 bacterium]|uniref:Secretion system C-terminal sorting domain-containing protein n=1 Tax=candidate division WOR-3 bacterium TaxID=2052148 RepID=A0A660SNN1_UNCW3|nr:MAG: hypothetical protein DRP53_00540 [candidate division WOR-3 bacterium]